MSGKNARLRGCGSALAAFALGAGLAGCADALLPRVKARSARILKSAIQTEFDNLTREFDKLDRKGDLALCAPVRFGVARFAVSQAVEEKRAADMAQLTRFLIRARAAIRQTQEKMRKKQCVDSDGDGLTDLAERRRHRTKPDSADTDGDGVLDGLEIRRYRTDPLKADTDADLLDDGVEISRGLSPLLADSDGDGFLDGVEIAHGANARDVCSQPLDAPRLARRRECPRKRARGERSRPQARKRKSAEPAPGAARSPDEKRRFKARKPQTRSPSPNPSAGRARSIGKAQFKRKERKPTPGLRLAPPGQKIQATRPRRVPPSPAKPRKEAVRNGSAPLAKRPPPASLPMSEKASRVARRTEANSEKSPTPAPVAASFVKRSQEAEKPPPTLTKNGSAKPAKKASLENDSRAFPSMIFPRVW